MHRALAVPFAALLFVVAAAPLIAADAAVPAAAVTARLVRNDLNFSLITPARGWKWETMPPNKDGATTLTVGDGRGERFSVSSSVVGYVRIDDHWMYDLRQDLNRDARENDYQITDFRWSRRGSPLFPSYDYSYTRRDKRDGAVSYVDGYVGAGNRVYIIQYASMNRAVLRQFEEFVASFQVVDKMEAQRQVALPGGGAQGAYPGMSAIGMAAALGRPIAPNSLLPIVR
ncbi:MAG TPA: hypothetical protein VN605_07140 [Thermoanaerobaculia bacterium]|nr:hypothetical protein [Thermoanaerobaculia bacterium]